MLDPKFVHQQHYTSTILGKMKVKDINRTANIAWSPAPQYPIYLAAGTAAQQLDATFRYIP